MQNAIDDRFKFLRVQLRQNGPAIADDVFMRFHPTTKKGKPEICIFCFSRSNITKEHVLPKWLFERETEITFISSVNRQTQTYNRAIVAACSHCNNSVLAPIEKHIMDSIRRLQMKAVTIEDIFNMIRWLEILEYKLQAYDCRRKYIRYGTSEYDADFGIFPVAMMRHFSKMDPYLGFLWLRRSQRRITVKSKTSRFNSFAVMPTIQPHFNFFVQPDEYIYISFPMFPISIFYFLKSIFSDNRDAYKQAFQIMRKVFQSP